MTRIESGQLSGKRTWDAHSVSGLRFALVLGLMLVVMFFSVVIGSKTFFLRDYGVMGLPVAYHHQQQWGAGLFPLWNPYSNCGAPFTAQWGTMVLYPLSLFYVLLPLPWSLNVFTLAHVFLGGVGMFCLVRESTRHGPSSALAGVAYAFSGTSLACMAWANYSAALAWIPWIFLLTRRAWQEGGRWIPVSIWLGSMQMLTGVPELILGTWIALALYWVLDPARSGALRGKTRLMSLGRLAVIVAGVAGVCAAQLLPFFDLLNASQRTVGFQQADWSTPVWGWANFWVPLFRTHEAQPGSPHFQAGQYFLTSYYIGVIPLTVVLWALLRHRNRLWLGFGIFAVLCVWFSMGEDGLLAGWLSSWVPGLKVARYPVKFLLMTAFVLPWLAGLALPSLLQRTTSSEAEDQRLLPRSWVVMVLVSCGVLAGVAWWSRQPFRGEISWGWASTNALERLLILVGFGVALFFWIQKGKGRGAAGMVSLVMMGLLMFVDGWTHNRELNPLMSSSAFTPGLWAVSNKDKPLPRLGEGRVFLTPSAELEMSTRSVDKNENRFLGRHLALWSHLNLLEGIPKFNGSSTLRMGREMDLENAIYSQSLSNITGLLDFLAVTYRNSLTNSLEWVRRPNPQPWVHAGVPPRYAPADQTALRVLAREFDPRREVWLSEEWRGEVGELKPVEARVETKSYASERVEVVAEASGPTLLTVAQSFSPNWRVEVDGQPARLLPVNHAFQGVLIPAGSHSVVFRYVDASFRFGLVISLVALGVTLWFWFRPVRGGDVPDQPSWSLAFEMPSAPRTSEPESSKSGGKFQA